MNEKNMMATAKGIWINKKKKELLKNVLLSKQ